MYAYIPFISWQLENGGYTDGRGKLENETRADKASAIICCAGAKPRNSRKLDPPFSLCLSVRARSPAYYTSICRQILCLTAKRERERERERGGRERKREDHMRDAV